MWSCAIFALKQSDLLDEVSLEGDQAFFRSLVSVCDCLQWQRRLFSSTQSKTLLSSLSLSTPTSNYNGDGVE